MTSQVLQFVDFTKTQKSKYLKKEALFFLQIKKIIDYTSRATLWQKNNVAVELTFKMEIPEGYSEHSRTSKMELFGNLNYG